MLSPVFLWLPTYDTCTYTSTNNSYSWLGSEGKDPEQFSRGQKILKKKSECYLGHWSTLVRYGSLNSKKVLLWNILNGMFIYKTTLHFNYSFVLSTCIPCWVLLLYYSCTLWRVIAHELITQCFSKSDRHCIGQHVNPTHLNWPKQKPKQLIQLCKATHGSHGWCQSRTVFWVGIQQIGNLILMIVNCDCDCWSKY